MSQNVNPKIGSGFQQYYQDNAGRNHGPTDLVTIANWENSIPSIGGRVSTATVHLAAVQLPSSGNYQYRRTISIANTNTSGTLWVGFNSGVTTLNGYPIPTGASKDFNLAATVNLWGVGAASGLSVSILEIA